MIGSALRRDSRRLHLSRDFPEQFAGFDPEEISHTHEVEQADLLPPKGILAPLCADFDVIKGGSFVV
jgi:hypothetical protein